MGGTVMFRKQRQPAPNFRMPGAPFNPVTGQRAQMGLPPTHGTIISTFQVIGDDPADVDTQDTHANYVVYRGYDPENDPFFRYLHDPKTKPETTSIKVAKPYGIRGTYPYQRGQIIVAARIATRFGFNQGKAATSIGHPASLEEETELLFDDGNVAIAWLDISMSSNERHRGVTDEALGKGKTKTVSRYDPGTTDDSGINDEVVNELASVAIGKVVYYERQGLNFYLYAAECPLT